jgi:hypothetical protein
LLPSTFERRGVALGDAEQPVGWSSWIVDLVQGADLGQRR